MQTLFICYIWSVLVGHVEYRDKPIITITRALTLCDGPGDGDGDVLLCMV